MLVPDSFVRGWTSQPPVDTNHLKANFFLQRKMTLTLEATYKTTTLEERKAHKIITIVKEEFGITGLFD